MGKLKIFEEMQQHATEHVVTLMMQDPEFAKFGIMISENIGMPSDQITLLWFLNTEQLVKFIKLSLPILYFSIEDVQEIPQEILEISKEIEKLRDPILQQDQINFMNSLMNLSSIDWVGSFNDLCEAKSSAGKMLIRWFRQEVLGDSPIEQGEREEFKDFLINNMYQ